MEMKMTIIMIYLENVICLGAQTFDLLIGF